MTKEARELKAALLRKEEIQSLLSNLEALKERGSITDQRYQLLKSSYQQNMTAAVSNVARIKSQLSSGLQLLKQDLNASKTELDTLRAGYNVGSVPLDTFQSSEQKLTKHIDQVRVEINVLQKLVEARAPSQLVEAEKLGPTVFQSRWAITSAAVVILLAVGLIVAWRAGALFPPKPPVVVVSPTQPSMPDSWPTAISKAQPSVVLIICPVGPDSAEYGSGTIIDNSGHILTNKHVIKDAIGSIFVLPHELVGMDVDTAKQKVLEARVLSIHPTEDLAIIEIVSGYAGPAATLGDSDNLKQGDEVVALGYPLSSIFLEGSGYVPDSTVTKGIVSSRTEMGQGLAPRIQTDTPINPGNSGGALINTAGELVGIPTSGIEKTPEAEPRNVVGINFAIPINVAKPFIEQTVGR